MKQRNPQNNPKKSVAKSAPNREKSAVNREVRANAAAIDDLIILPPCTETIEILQVDPHFLLINKPPRLLSVPGRHPQNRDSVLVRLQQEYAGAGIVHRLDFDTSGVMVIPLNAAALSNISKQFQARETQKMYTAVVAGLIEADSGVVDLPIAPDPDNRPKYKICEHDGKVSITEFRVMARDEQTQTTRVELFPVTGRSHQLRLHMQALGHPILGCEFYGNAQALAGADRLLLHATRLSFSHPETGESVQIECKPRF